MSPLATCLCVCVVFVCPPRSTRLRERMIIIVIIVNETTIPPMVITLVTYTQTTPTYTPRLGVHVVGAPRCEGGGTAAGHSSRPLVAHPPALNRSGC